MKTSLFNLFLIVMFCVTSLQSCEVLAGKNECEGSAMDLVEPVIYLKARLDPRVLIITPDTFLDKAEEMIITGSIQKEYCSGKLSGYFTYNPTFYPLTMNLSHWENGFYFPQPYQYKFDNKEDELILLMRFKAYTTDGRIYESGEVIGRAKYADIAYDVNILRYYIMISVPGSLQWFRVTS
jgi:hypothetical protein